MSAHTQGPWAVRDIPTGQRYIGPSQDGGAPSVALVLARVNVPDERLAADARLIAAAPELLRELQEARIAICLMLSYHGQGSADYADAAQVRAQVAIDGSGAAIAKATGEQQ